MCVLLQCREHLVVFVALSYADRLPIVRMSQKKLYDTSRGSAPIGAGGHDPPLFEAKGDGGT